LRLFTKPANVLVLDEPTNDLDLETLDLLQEVIADYDGTVLIVSHDRDLLNTVAEFILHLEHGKLTLYTGGYDSFQEIRAMRRALDAASAKKVELQRKHLQSFVDRFRAKATKA